MTGQQIQCARQYGQENSLPSQVVGCPADVSLPSFSRRGRKMLDLVMVVATVPHATPSNKSGIKLLVRAVNTSSRCEGVFASAPPLSFSASGHPSSAD